MRRSTSFALLVSALGGSLSVPLSAQRMVTNFVRGEMPAPRNLEQLVAALGRTRSGEVLVMEPRPQLLETLKKLQKEDVLLELNVPVRSIAPSAPLGMELREKFGWNEEARWAYLDAKGELRLEGTQLTSAQSFAEALLGAGFVDRGKELARFLATQPDHAQALEALLVHRFSLGRTRMQAFVKPPDPGSKGQGGELPELLRNLGEAEDQKVWGPAAESLDRLFRSQGWSLTSFGSLGPAVWVSTFPKEARYSQLFKEVARRHLPAVEEAVLKAPGSESHWQLWINLAGCVGNRSLRSLITRAEASPRSMGPLSIPPDAVLAEYMRECRAAKDWPRIKETLEPRLDKGRSTYRDFTADLPKGINMQFPIPGVSWDGMISPLLEAYLQSGDLGRAEQLVQDALAWTWVVPDLPSKASALARACGQDALATRWAALSTTKN